MKRLSSLIAAMLTVAMVSAIEPSTQIVTINGEEFYVHTVASGDTLYSMARAYQVSEQDIIEANANLSASSLRLGAQIYVPVQQPTTAAARPDGNYRLHTVEQGETILHIAHAYKISPEVLVEDNPGVDPVKLEAGSQIRIRRSQVGYTLSSQIEREWARITSTASEPAQSDDGAYIVRPGETVYSLSRRFNMTEDEFMQLNGLNTTADLRAGMSVRITPEERSTLEERRAVESVAEHDVAVDADMARAAAEIASGADTHYLPDLELNYDEADLPAPVDVEFYSLGAQNTLKLALMLPFHNGSRVNGNYVSFYRGMLLALEDLKNEGHSIELSVFDTLNSMTRIQQIVLSEDGFLDADLIIGPVYEDGLRYVVSHAEVNEVPVVSPLADIEQLRSPVLFQMQAENDNKYDKLADIFDGSREVVTIYAGNNDSDFVAEVARQTSGLTIRNLNYSFNRQSFFYSRNSDGSNGAEVNISDLLRTSTPKVFVVVARNETDVDRILTTLSSTRISIAGRGLSCGDYIVFGNRRWTQMSTLDHQLFFNNNVMFVVPYHAKRNEEAIRLFDGRYIAAYGAMPNMYSYRGYDAAMIFCRKMFSGLDSSITSEEITPLATTYKFDYVNGLFVNTNWTVEQYRSNYTIELR